MFKDVINFIQEYINLKISFLYMNQNFVEMKINMSKNVLIQVLFHQLENMLMYLKKKLQNMQVRNLLLQPAMEPQHFTYHSCLQT